MNEDVALLLADIIIAQMHVKGLETLLKDMQEANNGESYINNLSMRLGISPDLIVKAHTVDPYLLKHFGNLINHRTHAGVLRRMTYTDKVTADYISDCWIDEIEEYAEHLLERARI